METFEDYRTIYVKNREATLDKTNPRFLEEKVNADLGLKITAVKQIMHKSKIAKSRKNNKNILTGHSESDPGAYNSDTRHRVNDE